MVPVKSLVSKLLAWELSHPVDEDGISDAVVRQSIFPGGGLG
jgi:hypothetical protein